MIKGACNSVFSQYNGEIQIWLSFDTGICCLLLLGYVVRLNTGHNQRITSLLDHEDIFDDTILFSTKILPFTVSYRASSTGIGLDDFLIVPCKFFGFYMLFTMCTQ